MPVVSHLSSRSVPNAALVNCQKACKKCDDQRPCSRCVKYGIEHLCVNSSRKERRRGVKRGPYKTGPASQPVSDEGDSPLPGSSSLGDERSGDPDAWNPISRPKRTATRRVTYKDAEEEAADDDQSDSDSASEENVELQRKALLDNKKTIRLTMGKESNATAAHTTSTKDTESTPSVLTKAGPHRVLFNVVLGVMHGDIELPEDARLVDLARICSEEFLSLTKPQTTPATVSPPSTIKRDPYLDERTSANISPLSYVHLINRSVPTPPDTPVSAYKQQPTLYAPPPPGYYPGDLHSPYPTVVSPSLKNFPFEHTRF